MSKQSGLSSLLAAAASFVVIGMVAIGSAAPAQAQSEEDLAAPQGSFVSTMAAPADYAHSGIVRDAQNQPVVFYGVSEEDAAVPPGSFTSAMVVPEIHDRAVRLARDGR